MNPLAGAVHVDRSGLAMEHVAQPTRVFVIADRRIVGDGGHRAVALPQTSACATTVAVHHFANAVGSFRNTDPRFFLPGETLKGKTSINTPRVTGNLSGEYRIPVSGDRFELALRADALHTGRRYLDLANLALLEAVTRFNARATLTGGEGKWNASIFGRDLADEDTPLGGGLTARAPATSPKRHRQRRSGRGSVASPSACRVARRSGSRSVTASSAGPRSEPS